MALSVEGIEVVGDGRHARRARGRLAVIEALLDLLREGRTRLSVDEVAQRAGVSTASVFRYFESLDELHRLAFEHQLDQVVPMLHIPALATATFDERTHAFVRGRLDVYELIAGAARMGRARAADHPVLAQSLARGRQLWLQQVRDVFSRELATFEGRERRDVAALVDTVTSFEAWDLLSRAHGVSTRSITTSWVRTVHAALRA